MPGHACTGSSPHCVTQGYSRVIIKTVYQFKDESLQREKVTVAASTKPDLTSFCLIMFQLLLQVIVVKQLPLYLIKRHSFSTLVV